MKKNKNTELTLAEQAKMQQEMKKRDVAETLEGDAAAIWSEIKNKSIDMFALPAQSVEMHCKPIKVEPTGLYLILNSTSVLPSLEASIGNKFTLELATKYVIVRRANAI